jgi:hypothetical protein
MKKKIGTVLEAGILTEAKQRAVQESRPLSDIIQDALGYYLHEDVERNGSDALRACEKFCSYGSSLDRQQIDELLQEDMLTV